MESPLDTAEVYRSGITLLAFVLAFYALLAKERKTPYMVNSVYGVSYLVLISIAFSLYPEKWTGKTQIFFSWASVLILGWSLIYVIAQLWNEQNRHLNFRDDQLIKGLRIIRWFKKFKSKNKKPNYESSPRALPTKLIESLKQSSYFGADSIELAVKHHENSPQLSIAACFEINSLIKVDETLADVAISFLENDCFVQYTCCSRHPLEWLLQIKHRWEKKHGLGKWPEIMTRVVLVDAYTPHFGFTDSVYNRRSSEAKNLCIDVITARKTYAGVHTAVAKAFNKIKENDPKELHLRSPTLLIYEGCQVLADLESHEQYRIFLRHVIPSERLWGGMFTLFVESSLNEENSAILKSMTHIFITDKVDSVATSPHQ